MPSPVQNLIDVWEGKGQEDSQIESERLILSLKQVIDELQKSNTSAVALVSVRESIVSLRKHLEVLQQKGPTTYRQMMQSPNYYSDIHSFAAKVAPLLPGSAPVPAVQNHRISQHSPVPSPGSLRFLFSFSFLFLFFFSFFLFSSFFLFFFSPFLLFFFLSFLF